MDSRHDGYATGPLQAYSHDDITRPSLGVVSFLAAGTDAAIIVFAAAISFLAYSEWTDAHQTDALLKHLGAGILLAGSFVTLFVAKGAYRPIELMRVRKQMLRVAHYGIWSVSFLALLSFMFKIGDQFSRGTTLMFLLVCPILLIASRHVWARSIPHATARGLVHPRRIVLVCSTDYPSARLRTQIGESGGILTGVLTLPRDRPARSWIDAINPQIARSADEILVACNNADLASIGDLLAELRMMPMPVKLALDPAIADIVRHPMTSIGHVRALAVQRAPLTRFQHGLKRGFDVAFASTALLSLLPIFAVIALAIKLDSKGPVFFVQRRRGCHDRTFGIIKFRSMHVMEDGAHVVQATRNDRRVTRVGAFIRSTSIDELPQLWNVLTGQMSVVGPRPHAVSHDDSYDKLIARYAFRRNVKPGITGWAQINGCRGETPTIDSMEARVAHDLWYIHNWSLWLDTRIVLLTMVAITDRKAAC